MAKAKTDPKTATARAPKRLAHAVRVTDDDIARRAYDLYLARGGGHGCDVDDWMEARRELLNVTP